MTLVVDRQVQISEVLKRIGSQCMGFFAEQLDSTGQLIWRCFIDTPDPATTDAERMYHTDGGKLRLEQMAKDSLKVSLSPIENLATHVRLQYGNHLPFLSAKASITTSTPSDSANNLLDCEPLIFIPSRSLPVAHSLQLFHPHA